MQSNYKQWKKDLDKNIERYQSSIAGGVTELMDQGFEQVKQNAFIDAKGTIVDGYHYKEHPKANKPNKAGKNVFHKSKIMYRRGAYPQHWNKITWMPGKGTSKWKGTNGGPFKIYAHYVNSVWEAVVEITGKWRNFYANLHYGTKAKASSKIELSELSKSARNKRLGQRRIIGTSLRKPLNAWNRAIKKKLNKIKA